MNDLISVFFSYLTFNRRHGLILCKLILIEQINKSVFILIISFSVFLYCLLCLMRTFLVQPPSFCAWRTCSSGSEEIFFKCPHLILNIYIYCIHRTYSWYFGLIFCPIQNKTCMCCFTNTNTRALTRVNLSVGLSPWTSLVLNNLTGISVFGSARAL